MHRAIFYRNGCLQNSYAGDFRRSTRRCTTIGDVYAFARPSSLFTLFRWKSMTRVWITLVSIRRFLIVPCEPAHRSISTKSHLFPNITWRAILFVQEWRISEQSDLEINLAREERDHAFIRIKHDGHSDNRRIRCRVNEKALIVARLSVFVVDVIFIAIGKRNCEIAIPQEVSAPIEVARRSKTTDLTPLLEIPFGYYILFD